MHNLPQLTPDKKNTFRLHKWYLDCVTKRGEAFVLYCARLAWRSFSLTYASCLSFDGNHTESETSLLKERMPLCHGGVVEWSSKRLSFSGIWHSQREPLPPITLFENPSGSVSWHAQFPCSAVTVNLKETQTTGYGYAEQLNITIPPWQLPIEKLFWGRFVSKDLSVVWIEWQGAHPLSLVYVNGKSVQSTSISKSEIAWENGVIQHTAYSVLREGPLVTTALAKIPGLHNILPKSILGTIERKWLSPSVGTLNGTRHQGWSIHEVVQFKSE